MKPKPDVAWLERNEAMNLQRANMRGSIARLKGHPASSNPYSKRKLRDAWFSGLKGPVK